MAMGMALAMAAMMVPTAAPFFFAVGRDTRRPISIAIVVLIYVTVWAAIGFALDYVMGLVMMPSTALVVGIAVLIALAHAVTPWGRWAREQCRAMSVHGPRGTRLRDAAAEGTSYAACCVVCSAGVMVVLVVLGMSNPLVLIAGAAVLLAYKLVPWPAPLSLPLS